jgi:hypothetical protein
VQSFSVAQSGAFYAREEGNASFVARDSVLQTMQTQDIGKSSLHSRRHVAARGAT